MTLKATYEYIEKENKMKRRANMNFRRSDHSVVYNKGYLYAVGAFVDGKFSNSMERYTVSQDQWHQHKIKNLTENEENSEAKEIEQDLWELKDSMQIPRSGVGLCVFNFNYLYAFGGRNANNFHLDIIEKYDISKDLWEVVDNVKTDIWKGGAYLCQAHQVSSKRIIIFGKSGMQFDDSEPLKTCFEYTPETGDFVEAEQLAQHSAFVNPGICFNDALYYVGRNFKIHRYNEKWSIYNNSV